VLQYELSGFFAPIDMTQLNMAQAGKTVPVKWHMTDPEGNPVSDPAHFAGVSSTGDTCDSGPTDAIEDYAGSSGLQYLGDGNWQFNWKTPKDYAGQCRTLTLKLSDNSTLTADSSGRQGRADRFSDRGVVGTRQDSPLRVTVVEFSLVDSEVSRCLG
jgi:hypothetical protein